MAGVASDPALHAVKVDKHHMRSGQWRFQYDKRSHSIAQALPRAGTAQHRQTAQFVEVSTPSSGCIHRSTVPVSTGGSNIEVGTKSGGTSFDPHSLRWPFSEGLAWASIGAFRIRRLGLFKLTRR